MCRVHKSSAQNRASHKENDEPFNVFATYYFQTTLKPKVSFVISISRGLLVSGALILVLPSLFGGRALWWAIPLAEAAVAAYAVASLRRRTGV